MQLDDGAGFGTHGTDSALGADLLSVEETAVLLGCQPRNVRKYAPQFGGRKARGRWTFDPEDIAMEAARRKGGA